MRARGDKERSWWSTAAAPLPSQKARAGEWPKAKVASGQGGREGNRCLEPKWLRTGDSQIVGTPPLQTAPVGDFFTAGSLAGRLEAPFLRMGFGVLWLLPLGLSLHMNMFVFQSCFSLRLDFAFFNIGLSQNGFSKIGLRL